MRIKKNIARVQHTEMIWYVLIVALGINLIWAKSTCCEEQNSIVEFRLVCETQEPNCDVMVSEDRNKETYLLRQSLINTEDLESAFINNENSKMIVLRFDEEGKKKLEKVTSDNIDKRLGIIIDGKLVMTPIVRQPITNGWMQVSLAGSTKADADSIVLRINRAIAYSNDKSNEIMTRGKYYNRDGHFSLTLPDGWEVGSQSIVDDLNNQSRKISGKDIKFDIIFIKMTGATHPYITCEIKKNGRAPEDVVQKVMNDKGMLAKMKSQEIDVTKKISKDVLKKIEYGQMVYDKERNAIFQKIEGTSATHDKILFGTVLLTNYGQVTLGLNSIAEEYDSNFNDYNKILDSLKFDKGYEY